MQVPVQHGKPVSVEALVHMGDGSRKRLGDIAVGDFVVTLYNRSCRVLAVHEQGDLPVLRLTTASRRSVVAAPDHPFLTPHGWLNAGDLRPGDALVQVAHTGMDLLGSLPLEAYRLMGYFVGDGSSTPGYASVTCYDETEAADLERCAAMLGFTIRRTRNGVHASGRRATFNFSGGNVLGWLAKHRLQSGAHHKRVPPAVFAASHAQIANFLGAYFACDGSVNRYGRSRSDACVEFYSVSQALLADVQHLLMRLGIQSTLSLKNGRYAGQRHLSYRLSLTSQDNVARFVERIPVFHAKAAVMREWGLRRTKFDQPLVPDLIERIEPLSPRPCRCLTVAEDATFLADDFVVHNTWLASVGNTVWTLGNFPHRNVAAFSYSQSYAEDKIGRPARNLMEQVGSKYFGVKVDHRSNAASRWDLVDNQGRQTGGGFYCGGVGAGLAGRTIDLVIIDDPIGLASDAENPRMRDELWNWYTEDLTGRLNPGTATIIIMSRWHEDDLVGRVIAKAQTDGTPIAIVDLPALALGDGDEGPVKGTTYHDAMNRAEGEALVPEMKPKAFLELQRQRSPRIFSANYQGRPRPREANVFRTEWFRYYDVQDGIARLFDRDHKIVESVAISTCRIFATVDLNVGKNKDSAYFVCGTFAMTPSRDLLIVNILRNQDPTTEHLRHLKAVYAKFHPSPIGIEDVAYQGSLIQFALKEGLPIQPIKRNRETKEDRAEFASLRYAAGTVYHLRHASWLADFEDELERFPAGKYKDQVDVVSDACMVVAVHGEESGKAEYVSQYGRS